MQDDLTRAQRYRALAAQMSEAAEGEFDRGRRGQLLGLAEQYGRLADKLIGKGEAKRAETDSADTELPLPSRQNALAH